MVIEEHARSQAKTSELDNLLWDSYHTLLLSSDLSRIRKLLVRNDLFQKTVDVPGEVVECGVYKGAGLLYWAKLLKIFLPNSSKRVLGFDIFGPFENVRLREEEREVAERHDAIAQAISLDEIRSKVIEAGLSTRVELISGEITKTASEYVAQNYGFRISLLHLDLDTYAGTRAALEAFWPSVSRGGLIIFDEYAIRGMGESQAVDAFFADKDVHLKAVPFSETPTAYLVKS